MLVKYIYLIYYISIYKKYGKFMKLGELFCGAGGFAEGASRAGFKHIWASDNHSDSCISFEKNRLLKQSFYRFQP